MELPRMLKVRQDLVSKPICDIEMTLGDKLSSTGFHKLFSGMGKVAVAVGSRKISGLVPIVAYLVARLREAGCEPQIVPAMGSHGGATPEGQQKVLENLGVTRESVGAPVVSSMETVSLGTTGSGVEVFADRRSMGSGAIVVINRVAPHTGYGGPVQSGLQKMMAVGLGKLEGARSIHEHGFGASHLIGQMAQVALEKAPIVMGIALVEDGRKDLSRIEVLRARDIPKREPGLLLEAVSMWPRIPVRRVDVLIVEEIGKDISGIGMDPLVTGRGKELTSGEGSPLEAKRIVVLGLSEGSGGNATGIGHADVTTKRLVEAMDEGVTRQNVTTTGALYRAKLPVVTETEKEAVEIALRGLESYSAETATVVRIRNTRELESFQASFALAGELEAQEGVEVLGDVTD